jgi:hypothetical protein
MTFYSSPTASSSGLLHDGYLILLLRPPLLLLLHLLHRSGVDNMAKG